MNLIAGKQEPPCASACGEKHSMIRGIWRSICAAMLRGMNVYARTQLTRQVLAGSSIHNLLNRKVLSFRMFPMQ
jgi:hypothetical protein